jgi:hypothetical protein
MDIMRQGLVGDLVPGFATQVNDVVIGLKKRGRSKKGVGVNYGLSFCLPALALIARRARGVVHFHLLCKPAV